MGSKLAKFIFSFSATLLILLAGSFYFYKPTIKENNAVSILSFKFTNPKAEEYCDYSNYLEYYSYKDSPWENNNKFGLYIYAEVKDFLK